MRQHDVIAAPRQVMVEDNRADRAGVGWASPSAQAAQEPRRAGISNTAGPSGPDGPPGSGTRRSGGCPASSSAISTTAWAEAAAGGDEAITTAGATEVDTLTVTGFRASLLKAEKIKKATLGTTETILAEDIADFPEQNLADALQRIPGVTINRESGEGRQIQLRGLGADFTQVTLNGMESDGLPRKWKIGCGSAKVSGAPQWFAVMTRS